ncbi:MAG: ferrous iron transport protein A, partial [Planctomycetota bacterium]
MSKRYWESVSTSVRQPLCRLAAIAGYKLMVSLLPLFQLEPGQRARIRQLMGLPDQVHRLEELGLRAGSTVEMV